MEFTVNELADLETVADFLVRKLYKVYLFDGELGAGKTSLIQFMARKFGYEGRVNSPTFSKLHQYITPEHDLFHLDLYRVGVNVAELAEVFEQTRSVLLIEWASELPKPTKQFLGQNGCSIVITVQPGGMRFINIQEFC